MPPDVGRRARSLRAAGVGGFEVERAVWPVAVVMVNEGPEHALEVAAVDDQQPVEALGTDGADETLRDRVRLRRLRRRLDLDALACEDGVELACELAVAVTDQGAKRRRTLLQRPRELARLLGDPGAGRIGRAAGHVDASAFWGISTGELEAEQPTATTRAYTDFLLRTATLADYGELAAVLLPCMWGYHELAVGLARRGLPSNELYSRWIGEYAGAEFGELTIWCKALINAAAETSDRRRMTDAFLTSSRYELAFWDASWRKEASLRHPETPASTG